MNNDFSYHFELLGKHHQRAEFNCGVAPLDGYLHRYATQDIRKHVTALFVLVPYESYTVVGYYTLSATAISLEYFPKEVARHLPKYPLVPGTLIGRLAVDLKFRGKGLGKMLLFNALYRSWKHSHEIGSAAVIVDAKDEQARAFYLSIPFIEFPNLKNKLFLPMETVEKMFI